MNRTVTLHDDPYYDVIKARSIPTVDEFNAKVWGEGFYAAAISQFYTIFTEVFMNNHITLVALDMDVTLHNNKSQISPEDAAAIREASAKGVTVIISTGRPYVGLSAESLAELGICCAITSNGAAIYQLCS